MELLILMGTLLIGSLVGLVVDAASNDDAEEAPAPVETAGNGDLLFAAAGGALHGPDSDDRPTGGHEEDRASGERGDAALSAGAESDGMASDTGDDFVQGAAASGQGIAGAEALGVPGGAGPGIGLGGGGADPLLDVPQFAGTADLEHGEPPGAAANDVWAGHGGDDLLDGGEGDDPLDRDVGVDALIAGAGSDTPISGNGDTAQGEDDTGPEADLFGFAAADNAHTARIADFDATLDRIEITYEGTMPPALENEAQAGDTWVVTFQGGATLHLDGVSAPVADRLDFVRLAA